MAYLLGTNIPEKKKISIALTQIFGIGLNTSKMICQNLGLTENIRIFDLTKEQKNKLVRYIENSNFLIKSDLIRSIGDFRNHLINIRTYRGLRTQQGFPSRGQRTHTNSKTAKKLKLNVNNF